MYSSYSLVATSGHRAVTSSQSAHPKRLVASTRLIVGPLHHELAFELLLELHNHLADLLEVKLVELAVADADQQEAGVGGIVHARVRAPSRS